MIRNIITLLMLIILIFWDWAAIAYDSTNAREWKVHYSKWVDVEIPKWFAPSDNKDINHWLKVLPFEEYRYHDQYYVIPKMGLVAPLITVDKGSNDYKLAIKWKTWDYNKYLWWGAIIFPGTSEIGKVGNTFTFAHSSRYTNKAWKFKTLGRLYHNIEIGDKVRVYKKIGGKRIFFEYDVTLSKQIKPSETRILWPEKDKNKITFSSATCYEYWTAKNRRAFRSELSYVEELDKVLNPPKPVIKAKSTVKPKAKLKKSKTAIITWSIASGAVMKK